MRKSNPEFFVAFHLMSVRIFERQSAVFIVISRMDFQMIDSKYAKCLEGLVSVLEYPSADLNQVSDVLRVFVRPYGDLEDLTATLPICDADDFQICFEWLSKPRHVVARVSERVKAIDAALQLGGALNIPIWYDGNEIYAQFSSHVDLCNLLADYYDFKPVKAEAAARKTIARL